MYVAAGITVFVHEYFNPVCLSTHEFRISVKPNKASLRLMKIEVDSHKRQNVRLTHDWVSDKRKGK